MSQEMRGSEKLKAKCQTMASLTPEEIVQVAGGFSGNNLLIGSKNIPWLINGIPADPSILNSQQLQAGLHQLGR